MLTEHVTQKECFIKNAIKHYRNWRRTLLQKNSILITRKNLPSSMVIRNRLYQ